MDATKTKNKAHRFRLKRIFRMGSGLFIYSLVPILSWIILALIKGDPRIENVFSITYPMQFVYCIMVSLFATAANIRANKEKDDNHIYSSGFWGLIISIIVFLIPTIFVDGYITFFGQDAEIYREYVIYAFTLTIIQIAFSFVIEKMYFDDREKKANLHLLIFNFTNLAVLVVSSLIFPNFLISMIITLTVMLAYVVVLLSREVKKFKINFSFLKNFKYESANIVSYLFMFAIYLFGLKNAFCAGEDYVLALTVAGLGTDAFWDGLQAISKIAKIDLSKKRYDYKNELKNASIFSAIVVLVSVVMTIALALISGAKLEIVAIYLAFQVFDMLLDPFKLIMSSFTQLEYSPILNTTVDFICKGIRTVLSIVIVSPFCTEIGQMSQCILLLICYIVIRFAKFKVVDGKLKVIGGEEGTKEESSSENKTSQTIYEKTIDNN